MALHEGLKMSEFEVVATETVIPGSDKTKIMCEICQVSFVTRKYLNNHLRKIHQFQVGVQGTQTCVLCDEKFRTMALLHEHLQNQHSIALKFVDKTFYSEKDFHDWKNKMEEESLSSYALRNCSKKRGGFTLSYYNCHRSGHCKLKQNRIRNVKSSGSIKIGNTCPAILKVSVQTVDGISEINVQHQSVHLGHDCETHPRNLTKKDKENLAACLKLGIPIDKILDDVKRNFSPTSRYSLLTRKHLHNISRTIKSQPNDKKTQNVSDPPNANAEGSDSSMGFPDYHEADESDQEEVKENENSTAVSSLLLLQQQCDYSEQFKTRKVQILNQLKELQSRIEEWNPEYPLPEVEDHIKALNARLDIYAFPNKMLHEPQTLPTFKQAPPNKTPTKRKKIAKIMKAAKKSKPNPILN